MTMEWYRVLSTDHLDLAPTKDQCWRGWVATFHPHVSQSSSCGFDSTCVALFSDITLEWCGVIMLTDFDAVHIVCIHIYIYIHTYTAQTHTYIYIYTYMYYTSIYTWFRCLISTNQECTMLNLIDCPVGWCWGDCVIGQYDTWHPSKRPIW